MASSSAKLKQAATGSVAGSLNLQAKPQHPRLPTHCRFAPCLTAAQARLLLPRHYCRENFTRTIADNKKVAQGDNRRGARSMGNRGRRPCAAATEGVGRAARSRSEKTTFSFVWQEAGGGGGGLWGGGGPQCQRGGSQGQAVGGMRHEKGTGCKRIGGEGGQGDVVGGRGTFGANHGWVFGVAVSEWWWVSMKGGLQRAGARTRQQRRRTRGA